MIIRNGRKIGHGGLDLGPADEPTSTTERNARVAARYDELMREGKHGHYETLFRIVREEIQRL